MGLLDNLKAKLAPAKDKASHFAQQHEDKVDKLQHGIDKAARVVDEKTKGKYSDKIQTGSGRAKGAMDRFVHPDAMGGSGDTGGTAPGPTSTRPEGPPSAS
ncbi:antitoxin [Streptomyces sp. NPDC058464]|uniref:antitoxin n=1 Tax=Streptomyces sp. NPDC058464 TaxID=3346511 RepID=UPI00366232E7